MANSTQVVFCVFECKTDQIPHQESTEEQEFVNLFREHHIRSNKDGCAWSPVTMQPGTTRSNKNVKTMNMVSLDYDKQPYEPVDIRLKELGWKGIAHSTFQHSAVEPSFRVILFINRPMPRNEIEHVRSVVIDQLGGGVDPKTEDLSRIYYFPSCPPEGKKDAFFAEFDGEPIDVDELLRIHPLPAQKRPAKTTDSHGRIDRRAVADDVLKTYFPQGLMYCQGYFRAYGSGYWPKLEDAVLRRSVLGWYPGTTADDVAVIVRTLADLCHWEPKYAEEEDRLICLGNGTLDPIKLELRDHSPEPRLLSALPFDWDPDATAPDFMKFLGQIFEGLPDAECRKRALQEFVGHIHLPHNSLGHFLWLLGAGANGKSVLSRVIERMFGAENVTSAALERLSKASTRAAIAGASLNVSAEIGAEATLADGYFKAMVTGDMVDVEPKYKAPYSVRPRVKFLASTNHLPRLKDTSDGFARRGIILTFPRVFKPEEQNPYLEQRLTAEMAGIFVWSLEGLKRLLERGHFVAPLSSRQAFEEYRDEADPIRLFVRQELEPDPGERAGTATGDLFEAFKEWARQGNFFCPNVSRFGKVLTELNYPITRKSNGHPHRGLKLRQQQSSRAAAAPAASNASELPQSRKISLEEAFRG